MPTPRLPKTSHFVVDSEFWATHLPGLRPALLANDVGAVFRAVLEVHGCSQEALGLAVGMGQSDVSAVIRGERTITSVPVYRRIVEGLEMSDEAFDWLVPVGAFGRRPGGWSREDGAMNRREVLSEVVKAALAGGVVVSGALGEKVTAAARRPDPSTADHLAGLVRHLAAETRVRPMAEVLPMARSLAGLAESAISSAGERQGTDVGRAATEAAALHWWVARVAGEDAEAERAQAKAMTLAAAWDRPEVTGAMLARLGKAAIGTGNPSEGLRLIRAAAMNRRSPAAGRFLAAWGEAGAYALTGDREMQRSTVESAFALHARVEPAEYVLPALPQMDAPHLAMSQLHLRLLDEGPDIADAFVAKLDRFPAERRSDRAFFVASLAVARALAGDVAGATSDAETAASLAAPDRSDLPLVNAGLLAVARRPQFAPLRTALHDHGFAVA